MFFALEGKKRHGNVREESKKRIRSMIKNRHNRAGKSSSFDPHQDFSINNILFYTKVVPHSSTWSVSQKNFRLQSSVQRRLSFEV